MATITTAMSSFIILILFHTLLSSMATAQLESLPSYLLSATTRDASGRGLVLIINPIFDVESF